MAGPWAWAPHHDLITILTSFTILIQWGQNQDITGLDTQASNSDSDVEGEVDLRAELVSTLEELEKCRKKNKQSSHIISELEAQLLDAKRIEEELNLQLKGRIKES